jgi:hypothetical protein
MGEAAGMERQPGRSGAVCRLVARGVLGGKPVFRPSE